MDIKGLQLASRFALPPNSLGYCGRGTAPEKFKACIIEGKCKGVSSEISKFIGLGPYLKTISKIIKKEKYSYDVVEAYWLGNNDLKKVKIKDYSLLLKNFANQGVPFWLIEELKDKLPNEFIPNHLFQALFVGVGKMSGSVSYDMNTINNCMIRWGRVEKITKHKLAVKLNSLKKVKRGFQFTIKRDVVDYRSDFFPVLKIGDIVAVHWKQAAKKLDSNEVKKLKYWSERVLASLKD